MSTDTEIDIINYNPIVEEVANDEVLQYTQNNDLLPQHPFRAIICAPSGGGKSNLMLNLITKGLHFTKLFLFAKDLQEDKYTFLIKHILDIEKSTNQEILFVGSSINDIPDPNNIDKTQQNLIVFDDFLTDKNQKIIEDFYKLGRKRNVSMVYLAQVFHKVPKVIRENCDYLFLFAVNNNRELNNIAYTMASDINIDTFKKLYKKAISEPYGFLTIDKKTLNPLLKYRTKFNGIFKNVND